MAIEFITKMRGACSGGEVNLSRYPSLTYAPEQHGDGVRTHVSGKSVDDIYRAANDTLIVATLKEFANTHGVDFEELCDALRYGHKTRPIA